MLQSRFRLGQPPLDVGELRANERRLRREHLSLLLRIERLAAERGAECAEFSLAGREGGFELGDFIAKTRLDVHQRGRRRALRSEPRDLILQRRRLGLRVLHGARAFQIELRLAVRESRLELRDRVHREFEFIRRRFARGDSVRLRLGELRSQRGFNLSHRVGTRRLGSLRGSLGGAEFALGVLRGLPERGHLLFERGLEFVPFLVEAKRVFNLGLD